MLNLRPGKFIRWTLVVGVLATTLCWSGPLTAAPEKAQLPTGKGRIVVFRMVSPSGAHLDNTITVNGNPVQRISPGSGLYCDVAPGKYIIGLASQRARPLEVTVVAGRQQYICVMLNRKATRAPRSGALSADQPFDLRLLEPNFGAERVGQYRLVPANCQP